MTSFYAKLYTDWWQRKLGVNNLPKVVTWQRESNPQSFDPDCTSDAPKPPSHKEKRYVEICWAFSIRESFRELWPSVTFRSIVSKWLIYQRQCSFNITAVVVNAALACCFVRETCEWRELFLSREYESDTLVFVECLPSTAGHHRRNGSATPNTCPADCTYRHQTQLYRHHRQPRRVSCQSTVNSVNLWSRHI